LGSPGAYNDPYNINETGHHDHPAVKIQVENVEAKIHKQFMNCKIK